MFSFINQRYFINLGWTVLALITIVPLFMLSVFNHPSAADDYCFAWMSRDYGVLWSAQYYYEQWSGRYFANLLFHATPLYKGWLWYYKVLPVVYILSTFGGVYLLLGELIRTSRTQKILLSTAFLVLYILQLENVSESFFWVTGSYTYALPQLVTLYLWVILIRSYKAETSFGRYGLVSLAAFIVVALIGMCEIFVLLTTGLLACFLAYRLLFHKKLDSTLVVLVIVAIVSSYFVLQSPGVKIRQATNPLGGNIPFALGASIKAAVLYAIRWLLLVIIFKIFWIKWLSTRLPDSTAFSSYVRIRPWVGWLIWLGVLPVIFFPNAYGVGISEMPSRITNVVYFFYLIGFFYNTLVSALWIQERWNLGLLSPGLLNGLTVLAIVALPFFYAFNSNERMIIGDLKNGTAYRYDQELNARYAYIHQSTADTVVIAPLQNVPKSLYVDDVKSNPQHWWNKCEADYFNKKAFVLKP